MNEDEWCRSPGRGRITSQDSYPYHYLYSMVLKYDISAPDSIYLQNAFRYESHIEIRFFFLVAVIDLGYLVPGGTHGKS